MCELQDLIDKYDDVFPDGFPTIPLARGRSKEEVAEIIDNCIKQGKDVYELGYLENDLEY